MQTGDDLWLVGANEGALGGSLASDLFDLGATRVPTPLDDPLPRYRAIHAAICDGKVTAAHDCSEGGLAVAVSEMAIAARLGVSVVVPLDGLDPFTALVNEAPGRLVLSAAREHRDAVGAFLGDHGRRLGEVTAGDDIIFHLLDPVQGADSNLEPIRIPLADAVSASTPGPSGPTKGATP
jgi:phosphoribosylformylglycinamidine synthase